MNKINSLRVALTAAVPALVHAPDQLTVFINHGRIVVTGTRSPSFEYRYEGEIIIEKFTGDADVVFVAVVEWVRANQPDLVANPDERHHGISFVADVLDNQAVDLSIKVQLTENVVVTDGDGGRTIEHVDDSADRALSDSNAWMWECNGGADGT
ncbi:phage tail protein [Burkholderia sp. BCC1977]|uniref:phage tail protein n=1 Tax=Burkholderia sp. BCC1977 TaxID=2817440 RepID=UPI002ABD30F1|nr:phage tail protein [Burkholderia sp. BCC1977]